jgi:hypothetical protein
MEEKESSKLFGIEVPAEERTPLVERLFRVIEQQRAEIEQMRAEIARLKGLPPRPKIRPSTLNEPHPDPSHKKKRRGKRPGSAKRRKTGGLIIHETIPVPLEGLPEGTRQNGYEDFVVQELTIEAHNICYRRLRNLLPDGTSRTAPLPAHVRGHFGPRLRGYVLYQHHQNQVTQPLIHEELLDLGMDISTGQIDRLLTEGHDPFHEEKDALLYMKEQKLSKTLLARLAAATRRGDRIVWGDKAWERQLRAWGIHAEDPRRIVTEGALVGTLVHYEMYVDQPLVSDDAGQFQILGFLHALCWLHAERSLRKLLPFNPRERESLDRVRDDVWKYYQRLRAYRESPTPQRKAGLQRDFDEIFRRRTGFHDLNQALKRIHENREELLLVLDHPEIPLHNNLSESDIREWAKKRKISAGTRSELGRRCRDTFISLKKTCRKLGVSFWRYLQDRIRGVREILALPDLMREAAQEK